ncbi:zinc finger protein 431-like [Anopheles ziemanni]|uniref:zinc finger protein 431-like n=1 Tax=Anopheles coustani TaxID=139045 RepID=UPI00265A1DEB|nr:zinc finger protein 431-like [Anopheles coustani]XP_058171741.1 zinc finger protein 431-like [Anopheles ziemanni]
MATLTSGQSIADAVEDQEDEQSNHLQHYADNFDRLCRLCLSTDQLVTIYSNVQGRNVYYVRNFVKFALDLLAIKINKHDMLPNFICQHCERSLCIIFKFKKKCDRSLAILKCVQDSMSKQDKVVVPEADLQQKPKIQRKRKRRAASKVVNCEEILKQLPAGINIGKVSKNEDVTVADKCTVEQEPDMIVVEQPPSISYYENGIESALDQNESEDPIHVGDQNISVSTELQYEQAYGDDQIDPEAYLKEEKKIAQAKIEGELLELLDIDHHELDTEKNKSNGRRRAVCPVCGAMVNNVKSHLVVHSNVRPHQCDRCPKSFTTRNKLQSHTNSVHLRKRDFKCDVCGKAFLEKNNLKGHMRIHSGERNYTCDICGKSFLFAGTLRCHKLTHSQEKNHECQICGKLFLMRTTLNKHLNVHTDERPHKCDLCDKRFRTSTHKVVHMRTHTGEKPLGCYICEMSFAHHKARSVHMKTKHPEDLVKLGLIDDRGHLKV